jgi:hypothetical protein
MDDHHPYENEQIKTHYHPESAAFSSLLIMMTITISRTNRVKHCLILNFVISIIIITYFFNSKIKKDFQHGIESVVKCTDSSLDTPIYCHFQIPCNNHNPNIQIC